MFENASFFLFFFGGGGGYAQKRNSGLKKSTVVLWKNSKSLSSILLCQKAFCGTLSGA